MRDTEATGGRAAGGPGTAGLDVALFRGAANQWAADFIAFNNAGAAETRQAVGVATAFANGWLNGAAPGAPLQYWRGGPPHHGNPRGGPRLAPAGGAAHPAPPPAGAAGPPAPPTSAKSSKTSPPSYPTSRRTPASIRPSVPRERRPGGGPSPQAWPRWPPWKPRLPPSSGTSGNAMPPPPDPASVKWDHAAGLF